MADAPKKEKKHSSSHKSSSDKKASSGKTSHRDKKEHHKRSDKKSSDKKEHKKSGQRSARSARGDKKATAPAAISGPPSVLIQGANGNVGKAAAAWLLQHKSELRSLQLGARDPNASALAGFKADGAEIVAFDTANAASMTAALKGVDVLVLLPPGSTPSVTDRTTFGDVVIPAAAAAGVKHIVLLSVLGAEFEAVTFARQFRHIEKLVEATKIPYTFLRSGMFIENFYGWAEGIKHGGLYMSTKPDAKWAPMSVGDLGEAIARVAAAPLKHASKIYNITGPHSVSGSDVAAIFAKATGQTVNYVQVSNDDALKAMLGMGFPQWQADGMLELLGLVDQGATDMVSPDLADLLGRAPLSVAQFAEHSAAAFTGEKAPEPAPAAAAVDAQSDSASGSASGSASASRSGSAQSSPRSRSASTASSHSADVDGAAAGSAVAPAAAVEPTPLPPAEPSAAAPGSADSSPASSKHSSPASSKNSSPASSKHSSPASSKHSSPASSKDSSPAQSPREDPAEAARRAEEEAAEAARRAEAEAAAAAAKAEQDAAEAARRAEEEAAAAAKAEQDAAEAARRAAEEAAAAAAKAEHDAAATAEATKKAEFDAIEDEKRAKREAREKAEEDERQRKAEEQKKKNEELAKLADATAGLSPSFANMLRKQAGMATKQHTFEVPKEMPIVAADNSKPKEGPVSPRPQAAPSRFAHLGKPVDVVATTGGGSSGVKQEEKPPANPKSGKFAYQELQKKKEEEMAKRAEEERKLKEAKMREIQEQAAEARRLADLSEGERFEAEKKLQAEREAREAEAPAAQSGTSEPEVVEGRVAPRINDADAAELAKKEEERLMKSLARGGRGRF